MKICLSIIVFSFFILSQEKVDYQVINKIMDEGFKKSQVMDIAFQMTDVSGPRLTNSTGLKNAQNWAIKKLNEWGLKNVKLEPWGSFGRRWDVKSYSLVMTSPYFERFIAYPKAWTGNTNGPVSGKPVLVDINSPDDFKKYEGKLNGKIVVNISSNQFSLRDVPEARRLSEKELEELEDAFSEQKSRYDLPDFLKPYSQLIWGQFRKMRSLRQEIAKFMEKEGAAVILSSSRSGQHGTVFTSNGASYRTKNPLAMAELEVSREHHSKLVRLLQNDIDIQLTVETKVEVDDTDTIAYNVIGELPGSGNLKNEIVMIGAHYDSWHASTGATDNAAGSAVMMETIRILKSINMNNRNRRTIRIALWSGEEQGLYGSINYVKKHLADIKDMKLKKEHERISAYYNIDNGTGRIRGIYTEGNIAVKPIFKEYLKPFHDLGAKTITLKPTGGTDHMAFDAVGVPGFQFIQDPVEYNTRTHHTNQDSYERLQEKDLQQISIIVSSFVYHTATRPEKLPRKALPKAKPNGRFW